MWYSPGLLNIYFGNKHHSYEFRNNFDGIWISYRIWATFAVPTSVSNFRLSTVVNYFNVKRSNAILNTELAYAYLLFIIHKITNDYCPFRKHRQVITVTMLQNMKVSQWDWKVLGMVACICSNDILVCKWNLQVQKTVSCATVLHMSVMFINAIY